MTRGPIPLNAHAALDPAVAALLIAAPWLFGFSGNDTATIICVAAGVVLLLAGLTTRWRIAIVRLIPLRAHLISDLGIGAFLVLSPFIFGFSDEGGPARFLIIFGALEMLTALSTRWDEREAEAYPRGARRGAAHPSR